MCAGCVRHSTFDPQLLCAHILPNSASISLLDSHTSKKIRIYIKTRGFKPFRHTYLQSAISQSLLNHILTKNRGVGGGGCPRVSNFTFRAEDEGVLPSFEFRVSSFAAAAGPAMLSPFAESCYIPLAQFIRAFFTSPEESERNAYRPQAGVL